MLFLYTFFLFLWPWLFIYFLFCVFLPVYDLIILRRRVFFVKFLKLLLIGFVLRYEARGEIFSDIRLNILLFFLLNILRLNFVLATLLNFLRFSILIVLISIVAQCRRIFMDLFKTMFK
jgi:hypothetical protein